MRFYSVRYLKNNILSPGKYHFAYNGDLKPNDMVELEPRGCGVVVEEVPVDVVEKIGLDRIRKIRGKVENDKK